MKKILNILIITVLLVIIGITILQTTNFQTKQTSFYGDVIITGIHQAINNPGEIFISEPTSISYREANYITKSSFSEYIDPSQLIFLISKNSNSFEIISNELKILNPEKKYFKFGTLCHNSEIELIKTIEDNETHYLNYELIDRFANPNDLCCILYPIE